jgi:DNA-binding XRE family transcriptional regulator
MARTKRDDREFKTEMEDRAFEFSKFRQDNNLSQKLLSEIIGVCRRTIQLIEAGKIVPHADTVRKFNALKAKYEANGKSVVREDTQD